MKDILKGFTEDREAVNNVKIVKISKNNIVYIDEVSTGRRYCVHLSKMRYLKGFINELRGISDIYVGQFEKFINHYGSKDFYNLNLDKVINTEKAYSQY